MSDRTDIELPATGQLPDGESHGEAPDQGERQPSARELAMERIVANAEANRQREMEQAAVYDQDARDAGLAFAENEPDTDPSDGGVPVTDADAAPGAAGGGTVAPAAPAQPAPAQPQLVSVQVDGQQYQVTQEQLVHLARVGLIANQTVDQYQRQQAQPQFQQPVAPQPRAPEQVVDPNRVRETVKRIQYGTEDDAATALTELIGTVVQNQPRPQHVDPVAIANYAASVAQQQARAAHDTAVIRQEYTDIVSDPELSSLAAHRVTNLRQQYAALGIQKSDLDIFREAGDGVRARFNLPRPDTQAQPPASAGHQPASQAPNLVVRPRPATDARKREAPRSTQAVGLRLSSAEPQRAAPSGADIVENMRKARGQSSMR